MIKIDLPGYAVEQRNAIDGSKQKLPIVFGLAGVFMTQQGPAVTLTVWVEDKGKLVPYSNPEIVRNRDA